MKFRYFPTLTTVFALLLGFSALIAGCDSSANSSANKGDNATADVVAKKSDVAPFIYSESFSGLAIRGADPVAYFTQGQPIKGKAEFEYEWNDAVWRFSSQENLDFFAANPEQYAPQYGGYCAKAVSEGNLASINPESWKIVDDKLYLNYSPAVQRQWSQDIPGNIALGDENWSGVLNGTKVHENKIDY
ncbi:MAG: YHS domain-containing (seleno)protein [Cyanobacteria bacterium P01_C01_bin.72]